MDSRVNIEKVHFEKELSLVEYPGLVKNEEKAIETLGGIQNISRVFIADKKRLDLKFSRENVYNKPAFGDLNATTGFVLKVKIRRPKVEEKSDDTEESEQKISGVHSVDVLGVCRKTIRFNNPADYQYLPILKNDITGKDEFVYNQFIPKDIPDSEFLTKRDGPIFCVPGMFSRDTIHENLFRNDQTSVLPDDTMGIPAFRRDDQNSYHTFSLTDPIPCKPNPLQLKKMTVKFVTDEQWHLVKKHFDECPIWTKVALIYETKISEEKMKLILPAVAYYYTTGPWRAMHVRYGYDPRKDFGSRFYQLFDFRLRTRLGMKDLIKIKLCAKRELLRRSLKTQIPGTSQQAQQQPVQMIDYPYLEEGLLPRSRQCMVRYCDVRISKIQEMLQKIPTPLSGIVCNEKTGWLPQGFDEQCRQIITESIKDHFQNLRNAGAQNYEDEDEGSEEDEDDEEDDDEMDVEEAPDEFDEKQLEF